MNTANNLGRKKAGDLHSIEGSFVFFSKSPHQGNYSISGRIHLVASHQQSQNVIR